VRRHPTRLALVDSVGLACLIWVTLCPDEPGWISMVEHAVVIGAGVYGAAVAYSLTRRGAGVTVVDAGMPAGGTSGATFSWINSCGKQPRPYHDFSVASMEAHRRLAASGNDWYHESGNLEWSADDAGREELRDKVAGVLDYGYEARWLSRAEALRLEPDIDPAELPADEIAYFPREGWIDPARLVGHLLSSATSGGASARGRTNRSAPANGSTSCRRRGASRRRCRPSTTRTSSASPPAPASPR
jgi:glycine/D-amino acid oxidase-like deaminating enzyme